MTLNDTKCAEVLIQAGADVNIKDADGDTALMKAAICGNATCTKLLLTSGADVNISDDDGWTALESAGHFDHRECVLLLLKAGAYINNSTDRDGNNQKLKVSSKETATLLYAAGQSLNLSVSYQLAKMFKKKDLSEGLKDLCRGTIRKHLLKLNPQEHLFGRIPQLGLPSLLSKYLLYHVSIDQG